MGFLDRLLGRDKESAEDVPDEAKTRAEDMGQKAEDMGGSSADRAQEMGQEARTEAEDRTGRDIP